MEQYRWFYDMRRNAASNCVCLVYTKNAQQALCPIDEAVFPEVVTSLHVCGTSGRACDPLPDIGFDKWCIHTLIAQSVDIDEIIRLVGTVGVLTRLAVHNTRLSCDDFSRMPSSLVNLMLTQCELDCVPLNLALLFPSVHFLELNRCGITTLKGIEFPKGLKTLGLMNNNGMTLDGAVFPEGLVDLYIYRCDKLKGFNMVKLPNSLKILFMHGCHVEWVSRKMSLPPDLKILHRCLIPCGGCTVAMRNVPFASEPCGMSDRMDGHYNHQDAITIFIHNDVLPNELLRYIFAYLE